MTVAAERRKDSKDARRWSMSPSGRVALLIGIAMLAAACGSSSVPAEGVANAAPTPAQQPDPNVPAAAMAAPTAAPTVAPTPTVVPVPTEVPIPDSIALDLGATIWVGAFEITLMSGGVNYSENDASIVIDAEVINHGHESERPLQPFLEIDGFAFEARCSADFPSVAVAGKGRGSYVCSTRDIEGLDVRTTELVFGTAEQSQSRVGLLDGVVVTQAPYTADPPPPLTVPGRFGDGSITMTPTGVRVISQDLWHNRYLGAGDAVLILTYDLVADADGAQSGGANYGSGDFALLSPDGTTVAPLGANYTTSYSSDFGTIVSNDYLPDREATFPVTYGLTGTYTLRYDFGYQDEPLTISFTIQ